MTMTVTEAARGIIKELLDVARDQAAKEEARLGRKLTVQEATALAGLIERQFRTALVLTRKQ